MSRTLRSCFAALVAVSLALAAVGCGGEPTGGTDPESLAKAAAAVGSVNGLCPIMDKPVTKTGGSAEFEGKKYAFCCPGCDGKFREDPKRWIAKMAANPVKYGYKP